MPCTCNDETQTKKVICIYCHREETQPMPHHERVSGCSEHHDSIAICSMPNHMCDGCEEAGFYYESSGGGFFPKITIKNKHNPTFSKELGF